MSAQVPIVCPACHHKFTKSVNLLLKSRFFECPACHETLEQDKEQYDRLVKTIEQEESNPVTEVYCPECDFPYFISKKEFEAKPELYCRFCDKTFTLDPAEVDFD